MKKFIFILIVLIILLMRPGGTTSSVYIIDEEVANNEMVKKAVEDLTILDGAVVTGGVLSDYTSYAQVWDLRYSVALTPDDVVYMGNYLQSGGNMYLTGENASWISRNDSLISWFAGIGAGDLCLAGNGANEQVFVDPNNLLKSNPNYFESVIYGQGQTVDDVGNGDLITENYTGSGIGSLVGWDYDSIVDASGSRMLAGFDIEIFNMGIDWTENMYSYLDGEAPAVPIPEASTKLLSIIGLLIMFQYKKHGKCKFYEPH